MNAILHHISCQHGLDGKTEAEKNQVDLIENEIMDFRNGFVMLSYNPDFVSLIVHGSPLNKVLLSSNCQPHAEGYYFSSCASIKSQWPPKLWFVG